MSGVVKFLGKMFGDTKLSHLSKLDAFVLTSRWEGIPMAALEAAALGKPLLISKATNLGDFITRYDNGIVLKENSPLHISKAMHEFGDLITNNEIRKMGNKSLMLIQNELNWQCIAAQIIESLYN